MKEYENTYTTHITYVGFRKPLCGFPGELRVRGQRPRLEDGLPAHRWVQIEAKRRLLYVQEVSSIFI